LFCLLLFGVDGKIAFGGALAELPSRFFGMEAHPLHKGQAYIRGKGNLSSTVLTDFNAAASPRTKPPGDDDRLYRQRPPQPTRELGAYEFITKPFDFDA